MKKIHIVFALLLIVVCAAAAYWYLASDHTQSTKPGLTTQFSSEDAAAIISMLNREWGESSTRYIIYPSLQWNEFYQFGLTEENAGSSVVMTARKRPDSQFEIVMTQQEPRSCADLVKLQVPYQVEETCYDDDGDEVENPVRK